MSDYISRQAAITLPVMPKEHRQYQTYNLDDVYEQGWYDLQKCIEELPSAQPEITDEQAIEHLQASGWMQNHDREIYESGLKERLADDSGDYDSLIPCEDTISRQAAIDALRAMQTYKLFAGDDMLLIDQAGAMTELMLLPSAQPKSGRWLYCEDSTANCVDGYRCDQCGFFTPWDYKHKGIDFIQDYNFCPKCGADMRGEQDE